MVICSSILREIVLKQRMQYFGCVPMGVQEKYIEKLKQAVIDKKEAFISMQGAQEYQNEALMIKTQLEQQTAFMKELQNLVKSGDENIKAVLESHEEKCKIQLQVSLYVIIDSTNKFNFRCRYLRFLFYSRTY